MKVGAVLQPVKLLLKESKYESRKILAMVKRAAHRGNNLRPGPNAAQIVCRTMEASWPRALDLSGIRRSQVQIFLPATTEMDLRLMVPDSTPPCFVNIQLISLLPVGIFNKFRFNLQLSHK